MKLESTAIALETNNVSPHKIAFRIGKKAVKLIMMLRSSLYSKPIQTSVQEYLSNARDAMREAGRRDQPIQVTLPTRADAKISIRDFGVGLDETRVATVFTEYGESTKEDSDDETGGYGIGAKSAWAYTDSFMVITYLNGKKRTYLCHLGDGETGTMELMSEGDTNEPNGTEVQIALKTTEDIPYFVKAVYRATMFWQVKPELKGITEKEIPSWYLAPKASVSGENWYLTHAKELNNLYKGKGYYESGLVLAVDGIPYELSNELRQMPEVSGLNKLMAEGTVMVIQVANNAVKIPGSREEITDCPKTRREVARLTSMIAPDLKAKAITHLSDFTTVDSMVSVADSFKEIVALKELDHELSLSFPSRVVGGHALPKRTWKYASENLRVIFNDAGQEVVMDKVKVGKKIKHDGRAEFFPSDLTKVLVVDEPELKTYKLKKKLKQFVKSISGETVYVVSTNGWENALNPMLSGYLVALMSDLQVKPSSSVQLPLTPRAERQARGESLKGFDTLHLISRYEHNEGDKGRKSEKGFQTNPEHVERAKLADFGETIYVVWDDESYPYGSHLIGEMADFLEARDVKLVQVSKRVASHLACYSNFRDFLDYMTEFKSRNLLTADEVLVLEKNSFPSLGWGINRLESSLTAIKEPLFAELLSEAKKYKGKDADHLKSRVIELAPAAKEISERIKVWHEKVNQLQTKYRFYFSSLYEHAQGADKAEVILYLNAKYEQG